MRCQRTFRDLRRWKHPVTLIRQQFRSLSCLKALAAEVNASQLLAIHRQQMQVRFLLAALSEVVKWGNATCYIMLHVVQDLESKGHNETIVHHQGLIRRYATRAG